MEGIHSLVAPRSAQERRRVLVVPCCHHVVGSCRTVVVVKIPNGPPP